jgi:hypothetical protein
VVPVPGEHAGVVDVDDLARVRLLDLVRLTERDEPVAVLGEPDRDVALDPIQVERACRHGMRDRHEVVGVDRRADPRQVPGTRETPSQRVDARTLPPRVCAEVSVRGMPAGDRRMVIAERRPPPVRDGTFEVFQAGAHVGPRRTVVDA